MKYISCILLLLCFGYTKAQTGNNFPYLTGKTLDEKSLILPNDIKGRVSLIALAYSSKSDKYLRDWLEPVYRQFINPPASTFIPSIPYDVNIYFVALLKGLAKTAKGKVESSLNKNLDPEYYKHTLISTDSFKPLKAELKLGKKDYPYFFILDDQGKIIYTTQGLYTRYKMQEIVDLVDKYSGR